MHTVYKKTKRFLRKSEEFLQAGIMVADYLQVIATSHAD